VSVICISRQLGTLGSLVAANVARSLSYGYVDSQITGWISSRSGLPAEILRQWDERGPRTFVEKVSEHLAVAYGGADWGLYAAGGYHEVLSEIERQRRADYTYHTELPSLIEELGRTGFVVIVGRAAGFLLKGKVADLLHVRLAAGFEARVRVVRERMSVEDKEAREMLTKSDEQRRRFVRSICDADLEDPLAYDFIINTEWLSAEDATDVILHAAKARGFAGTASSARGGGRERGARVEGGMENWPW